MAHPTSPELALAIACCRWPRSPQRETAVREAADLVADWDLFDRMVVRHRITPLARDALACAGVGLPPALGEKLRVRAVESARAGLALARESVRVQRAFRAAGLPALIIKGTAIGIVARGDPYLKESWDVDLLTSTDALNDAHELLERLGYELHGMDAAQLERFAQTIMEAQYLHRESGITIELHWRVTQNRRLLPDVSARSPSQVARGAGLELVTFADDILFAYLCVHGSQHAWARLKWLADFGAFVASREPDALARLYDAARPLGAARAATAALLLSHRLLDTPLPSQLAQEPTRSAALRFLETTSLFYINRPVMPSGPDERLPLRLLFSHYIVGSGRAFYREQVRLHWDRPVERERFGRLFHLLRIPLWLGREARRAWLRSAMKLAGRVSA
jgi:hypothetical protein